MNRIIKFRVWDKDYKKFISLGDAIEQELVCYFLGEGENELQPQYDSIILMQFTNLHDKNGKEIYESDVLDAGDRIVKVVWHELAGQWDTDFIAYKGERNSNSLLNADWGFRTEVIGNIYENPEFLKGAK